MSAQVSHKSVIRVQNSIIRDEQLYEEHNHQVPINQYKNYIESKSKPDERQGHLLRNHHQQPTPETSDLDLDSGEQVVVTYASDRRQQLQNGRAGRQQTRPSRPSRRPMAAQESHPELSSDMTQQQPQQPGDSPQRVRLSESFIRATASGRSRSAAATPRGQARDRAPVVTTRMGRFVDSYPASRQARSSGRSTSPYAFHVPPPGSTLSRVRSSDRSTIYATPTSRATSPSYAYAEYYHTDAEQQQQPVSPQRPLGGRAVQYGYVARAEGDRPQRPPAASKFNRSLRSRTIAHLPSMVQVTNGELLHEETERLHGDHHQANVAAATSEGDLLLLKAHTIAWRSSDLGRENPFRPGTELSLEADLMVRLMKRGYPIDELPRLVEAAKSEVAAKASARSKSCDRLTHRDKQQQVVAVAPSQSQGHLRANLRREAERHPPRMSNSQSHQALVSGGHKPEVQAHDKLGQPEVVRELDEAKAVWANSLKRAKSMPRFGQTDTDSLDQLITSIELEISDLLEKTTTTTLQQVADSKQPVSEKVISGGHQKSVTLERVGGENGSKTGSAVKTRRQAKAPASPKQEASKSRNDTSRETAVTPTVRQVSAAGQDLGTSVARPRRPSKQVARPQARPPTRAVKRKDKPRRCCSIQ